MRQECILLRFIESMNFIYEQQCFSAGTHLGLLRNRYSFPYILNPRQHRRQRLEVYIANLRNEFGNGGLTDTGRPPEDHGMQLRTIDRFPQRLAG